MTTIKKIIKALIPHGDGISAGHLGAAFYFGVAFYAMTEAAIFSDEFDVYIIIANILSTILLMIATTRIVNGIQAAQIGSKCNKLRMEMLELNVDGLREALKDTIEQLNEKTKRCDCGLMWGHTGRHAPHSKKKTTEK